VDPKIVKADKWGFRRINAKKLKGGDTCRLSRGVRRKLNVGKKGICAQGEQSHGFGEITHRKRGECVGEKKRHGINRKKRSRDQPAGRLNDHGETI